MINNKSMLKYILHNWGVLLISMFFTAIPYMMCKINGVSLWYFAGAIIIYLACIICYAILKIAGVAEEHEKKVENYLGKCHCKVYKYGVKKNICIMNDQECLFLKGHEYEQAPKADKFSLIDGLGYIIEIPIEMTKYFYLI